MVNKEVIIFQDEKRKSEMFETSRIHSNSIMYD